MRKKKWLIITASLVVLVASLGLIMFGLNAAPKVPVVSIDDPAVATRPYVVKLHAQWCAVCMITKSTWTKLQAQYAARVNLVVFDLTNRETTEASRSEATRLGLGEFFDAHSGEIGSVYVLKPGSKEVETSLDGVRSLADYTAAIDQSLKPKKD